MTWRETTQPAWNPHDSSPNATDHGQPPLLITHHAKDSEHAAFPAPTARNVPVSRTGTPRVPIIPAHESRIVGIPPFSCRLKDSAYDDAYPFSTPIGEIRAYLLVGAGTNADQSDFKITDRWKMAVSESYERSKSQRITPPQTTNREIRAYLLVGAGLKRRSYRHAKPKSLEFRRF